MLSACSRIFRSQYLGIGFEMAMCRCVVGTDEVTERKGWGRASCELDVVCRIRHNTQLVLATPLATTYICKYLHRNASPKYLNARLSEDVYRRRILKTCPQLSTYTLLCEPWHAAHAVCPIQEYDRCNSTSDLR